MKATRYEYMKVIEDYLKTSDYPNQDLLEISGNTLECHQFFQNITTVHYPEVDAHNLPHKDESFDCVILNQVLEHVKRPWIVIDEVYRVLREGGIAILSSPFFYQVHDHPGDYWRFTPEGLLCLTENSGFKETLMTNRSGNSEMIRHMIDHPEDRKSERFLTLAKRNADKSKYFTISTVAVRK